MITFFDLIQKEDFRDYVSKRIASGSHEAYSFPKTLPLLYKYRSLSAYAVDDIVNNKLSLTAIGDFNDIYDGAIHQYGTMEDIEKAAEAKWNEMKAHRIAAHLPEDILRRDDIVKPYIDHFKTESRLKFRELDFLGTYVCCFSTDNCSTLMWAHYADSNRGISIEYDFNQLPTPNENLLYKSIFPVAYTSDPIDIADLLTDKSSHIYQYPLDAAVLCTALNKSTIWKYEREWRIVWVLASSSEEVRRLPINLPARPSKVSLGYHFLKSFFYYSYKNAPERKNCKDKIIKFLELIAFLKKNGIPVAIMVPSIGSYQFVQRNIPIDELYGFMLHHFQDEEPESMRYYYTVHDHLMNLIDKVQEVTHV